MMGSVAPPVFRHRQQTPNLVTGVRQGLQEVHQDRLMRTALPWLSHPHASFEQPRPHRTGRGAVPLGNPRQ